MAKTNFSTVDQYISMQPEAVRSILECVRTTIRQAVPEAHEVISYQIPAFKLHGKAMLFFAGWKQHFSIYPATDLAEAFKAELAQYHVSRGTIRFPLSEPVPVSLIRQLAQFRAAKMLKEHATQP